MWYFDFLRFHHQLIKKHWTYFLVYNIKTKRVTDLRWK